MRRYTLFALTMGMMTLLLVVPQQEAVREGLTLCAQSVVPALFPFFVAGSLFLSLGYAQVLGRSLAPFLHPLLGCREVGASVFLLGLIGGYPVGARSIAELRLRGQCSAQEAERLLCCCNNAGPAFILGIAGEGCFHSPRQGLLLYAIHILSALLTGMLLGRNHQTQPALPPPTPTFPAAFVEAVRGGAEAMVQICGFVVFFRVLLQLLPLRHPLLLGAVELTAGVLALPNTPSGFVCCAGLLGWGGLSVHCQTAAVLSGSGIPMQRYLLAKGVQAALSMLLSLLLLPLL